MTTNPMVTGCIAVILFFLAGLLAVQGREQRGNQVEMAELQRDALIYSHMTEATLSVEATMLRSINQSIYGMAWSDIQASGRIKDELADHRLHHAHRTDIMLVDEAGATRASTAPEPPPSLQLDAVFDRLSQGTTGVVASLMIHGPRTYLALSQRRDMPAMLFGGLVRSLVPTEEISAQWVMHNHRHSVVALVAADGTVMASSAPVDPATATSYKAWLDGFSRSAGASLVVEGMGSAAAVSQLADWPLFIIVTGGLHRGEQWTHPAMAGLLFWLLGLAALITTLVRVQRRDGEQRRLAAVHRADWADLTDRYDHLRLGLMPMGAGLDAQVLTVLLRRATIDYLSTADLVGDHIIQALRHADVPSPQLIKASRLLEQSSTRYRPFSMAASDEFQGEPAIITISEFLERTIPLYRLLLGPKLRLDDCLLRPAKVRLQPAALAAAILCLLVEARTRDTESMLCLFLRENEAGSEIDISIQCLGGGTGHRERDDGQGLSLRAVDSLVTAAGGRFETTSKPYGSLFMRIIFARLSSPASPAQPPAPTQS